MDSGYHDEIVDPELEAFLTRLLTGLENNLRREIEATERRLSERIAGVEQRVASVEQKVAGLEQRLTYQLDTIRDLHRAREVRFIGLEMRMNELEGRFEDLEKRIPPPAA